MKTIKIGTRGSRLALVQSESIKNMLMDAYPELSFEIVPVKTKGDKILDVSLSKIGDKGLFTREIEKELIAGDIDLAVHSMKDMPTKLPGGLIIGAVTERIDPRDVLIAKPGISLNTLSPGKTIATGSLRRKAQLQARYPGIKTIDIRGNIQTRIKKMKDDPAIDGTILAFAGLDRMGLLSEMSEVIDTDIMIPAVGQGALAVQIRDNDPEILTYISVLNHKESEIAASCERKFLALLEGGCQVPIAGHARISEGSITLTGMVASIDGSRVLKREMTDSIAESEHLGERVASALLNDGADSILSEIYGRDIKKSPGVKK